MPSRARGAAERGLILPVAGAQLHAVEVGEQDPAAPEVVVLHGGPAASLDYLRPQLDGLADGRRLLYFDQRGGGQSRTSGTVTASDLVEDLEAIRRQRGDTALTLLGYSWGALLALLYAVAFPNHVGRLALLSPAPARAGWRREMQRRLAERSARPEARAMAQLAEAVRDRDPARARKLRFAAAVAGYFMDPARALDLTPFVIVARTQQSIWRSLGAYDLVPSLGKVAAPALIVHGAEDPIPLAAAREIAGALPDAGLLVLRNVAHVPFIEGADECLAALDRFLPRIPA